MGIIDYPFDSSAILGKKKSLRRQLLQQEHLLSKRIAIVSGSTIGVIKDILELFLLNSGIKPLFYEGQYNLFYEDIMFENHELSDFNPDLIYIHTTSRNLSDESLFDKLHSMWERIKEQFKCSVIQNNFDLPASASDEERSNVMRLNIQIDDYARRTNHFYVNDIHFVSANYGLSSWHSEQDYFLYKYAFSITAIPYYCHQVAKIIKSLYGKSQKCLVLDLDNTLWGGIVGEVGVEGIQLGMESALGEAYISFQKYVKYLHSRGIVLAVSSKNNEAVAKSAFNHPNMVLCLEDISVFCAGWGNKAETLVSIANQLNILPESMVFVDDNPAERELIKQAMPDVKVLESNDVVEFIRLIEEAGYFYTTSITQDDIQRNKYYAADVQRTKTQEQFIDYSTYLTSLQMTSEIKNFSPVHLDRIAQLINKTNQFNLTTQRYSLSEISKMMTNARFLTLYGTLNDKFGSNGIVSALVGEFDGNVLHIRLWVMSCRVFKRDMEYAMFDKVVQEAKRVGVKEIKGYYFPTSKNKIVSDLYLILGFVQVDGNDLGNTAWTLLVNAYVDKCNVIDVK